MVLENPLSCYSESLDGTRRAMHDARAVTPRRRLSVDVSNSLRFEAQMLFLNEAVSEQVELAVKALACCLCACRPVPKHHSIPQWSP